MKQVQHGFLPIYPSKWSPRLSLYFKFPALWPFFSIFVATFLVQILILCLIVWLEMTSVLSQYFRFILIVIWGLWIRKLNVTMLLLQCSQHSRGLLWNKSKLAPCHMVYFTICFIPTFLNFPTDSCLVISLKSTNNLCCWKYSDLCMS